MFQGVRTSTRKKRNDSGPEEKVRLRSLSRGGVSAACEKCDLKSGEDVRFK